MENSYIQGERKRERSRERDRERGLGDGKISTEHYVSHSYEARSHGHRFRHRPSRRNRVNGEDWAETAFKNALYSRTHSTGQFGPSASDLAFPAARRGTTAFRALFRGHREKFTRRRRTDPEKIHFGSRASSRRGRRMMDSRQLGCPIRAHRVATKLTCFRVRGRKSDSILPAMTSSSR